MTRLLPRSAGARVAVGLGAVFVLLWIVFAVRAVDRNDEPFPTVAPSENPALADLQATAIAVMTRFPVVDATDGRRGPSMPASPVGSPVGSPAGPPVGSPVGSPVATLAE